MSFYGDGFQGASKALVEFECHSNLVTLYIFMLHIPKYIKDKITKTMPNIHHPSNGSVPYKPYPYFKVGENTKCFRALFLLA